MYYVYFSATLAAENMAFPGNLFVNFTSNSIGILDYNYYRC